eukprot:scaffold249486_cov31-Attheya_sp.AAC.1
MAPYVHAYCVSTPRYCLVRVRVAKIILERGGKQQAIMLRLDPPPVGGQAGVPVGYMFGSYSITVPIKLLSDS